MALVTDDLIRGELHRAHEDLSKLSERTLDNPAQVAEQLRAMSKRLETMALVCDMAAMQEQEVAS